MGKTNIPADTQPNFFQRSGRYSPSLAKELDRISESEHPLTELRKSYGITQQDISIMFGASYRSLQNWNRSNSRVPVWVIRILLEAVLSAKNRKNISASSVEEVEPEIESDEESVKYQKFTRKN